MGTEGARENGQKEASQISRSTGQDARGSSFKHSCPSRRGSSEREGDSGIIRAVTPPPTQAQGTLLSPPGFRTWGPSSGSGGQDASPELRGRATAEGHRGDAAAPVGTEGRAPS